MSAPRLPPLSGEILDMPWTQPPRLDEVRMVLTLPTLGSIPPLSEATPAPNYSLNVVHRLRHALASAKTVLADHRAGCLACDRNFFCEDGDDLSNAAKDLQLAVVSAVNDICVK